MVTDLYQSNQSVPHRVDIAWQRGYETGRAEWKRLAPVALLLGLFAVARHRHVPVPIKVAVWYGAMLATLILLVLTPVAVVVVLTVLVIRHHKRRRSSGSSVEPFPEWTP